MSGRDCGQIALILLIGGLGIFCLEPPIVGQRKVFVRGSNQRIMVA